MFNIFNKLYLSDIAIFSLFFSIFFSFNSNSFLYFWFAKRDIIVKPSSFSFNIIKSLSFNISLKDITSSAKISFSFLFSIIFSSFISLLSFFSSFNFFFSLFNNSIASFCFFNMEWKALFPQIFELFFKDSIIKGRNWINISFGNTFNFIIFFILFV